MLVSLNQKLKRQQQNLGAYKTGTRYYKSIVLYNQEQNLLLIFNKKNGLFRTIMEPTEKEIKYFNQNDKTNFSTEAAIKNEKGVIPFNEHKNEEK